MLGSWPIFLYLLLKPKTCLGKCIPHFPIGPKMKMVKIKNKTYQTKDLIKRLKTYKNTYVKKLHPQELFTFKNIKVRG